MLKQLLYPGLVAKLQDKKRQQHKPLESYTVPLPPEVVAEASLS
jgi:hypothetical protein